MAASEFYAERLAKLVTSTRFSDFDLATLDKARIHILDTLGVMLAGADSDETTLALRAMAGELSIGQALIVGHDRYCSGRDAAMLNGISAHALELDDSGGCDHSGAVVLPAVLAALAKVESAVNGKLFLQAVILGYEVGRRVLEATGGYESHNAQGWHSTGTCGVFGAAVACAVLLELDTKQVQAALGIAASFAGGTWSFIHDGSQTKKLHAGRAAEGGYMAAHLAKAGMSGPNQIFENDSWGSFLSSFNQSEHHADDLIAEFGQYWRVNRCSIKPYATCRGTHSAIDSLRYIQSEHGIKTSEIDDITVVICPFQAGMCAGTQINSRAQAQMSIAYALCSWLEFNEVGLSQLEAQTWQGDWWSHWMAKVSFQLDDSMADNEEPVIQVSDIHGNVFSHSQRPLGSPQNPLSMAQIIEKFQSVTSHCLDASLSQQLIDCVRSIEQADDVHSLLPLVAKRSERT